ncbi:MAG: glucosamine-6-phosphate deaminase [Verrucomicrobia bacterium]|nr:glucosamine-6-phosphate deaminase [Verrucomicrobiota bacterium]NMD19395.1 glucosamine-6-phosphate deaminase [Verrucomicrobiota bacterium]OQC64101.1 MAG: Glucosamine-6-phosphate deaminase 1 [Verrucomicrobia bacterium ADurb.Bin006]
MTTAPLPMRTFTVDCLAVRVHSTQSHLAADAADAVARHLEQALEARPQAAAILASATSQIQFLDALAGRSEIDWSRVTVFHMDEYLGISADHPASFRRFMRERVESRLRPQVFHSIGGDCLEPLVECDRYAALLRAQPIDLCCLGIGENGHVAFNDPPVADFNDPRLVKLVKLDEPCRRQQVGEGCFPTLESVPQYAFSLTVPALCAARKMVCVVPERRKADAVRRALRGPVSTACPASILRRQPHATLFLDAESAAEV